MKKLCIIFFCFYGFGLTCFAAEAPCGIDKEAERIVTLAKSELGIYSGVVTPFVTRILDSGGMDIAPADATFDQLSVQAKKDGYNLGNVVFNLKRFNRLVVNCKEYPEYVKRKIVEKELAVKEKELKRQADLARLKKNERLEKEKEIQREIDLENEKKRLDKERIVRFSNQNYSIQVGAFADFANAQKYSEKFIELGYQTEIIMESINMKKLHTVQIGSFVSLVEAQKEKDRLESLEKKKFKIKKGH